MNRKLFYDYDGQTGHSFRCYSSYLTMFDIALFWRPDQKAIMGFQI